MPFIQINNKPHYFKLRRSLRAKHLQMILRQYGFEVIAPFQSSNRAIIHFIWLNQKWMQKSQNKQQQREGTLIWPSHFLSQEQIPFRERMLCLNIKFDQKSFIRLQENSLIIRLPWQTPSHLMEHVVKQQVTTWYHQETISIIQRCIDNYCPRLGKWPKGFALKLQKTRWGSCGINQKIYLNWLLILAPPGVLEYVVLHELCHLLHLNHGKRFWARVAQCMPEYQIYEKWLRKQGQSLLLLSDLTKNKIGFRY